MLRKSLIASGIILVGLLAATGRLTATAVAPLGSDLEQNRGTITPPKGDPFTLYLPANIDIPPVERGGVWVHGSVAAPSNLNPILSADSPSSDVHRWFFPRLIGLDANTGALVPTEMATRWEVSDDGLTWTFYLRDGVVWSDGNSVDAIDFKFTYDAIASDQVESPRKSAIGNIKQIEVVNNLTAKVEFGGVQCDALVVLQTGWLPSHLYASDFSDIMDNPYNQAPPVSAGPFLFQSWAQDDTITTVRNETYWKGAPNLDGWRYKVVVEEGVAQLQNGAIDLLGLDAADVAAVQTDPDLNLFTFEDDGYSYIALNLADPSNPQPGQDDSGNIITQDPHPILSELAVRQAIAHAVDYDSILQDVYMGGGYRIASNVLPAIDWAHNDALSPYPFNATQAQTLLTNEGWVDADNDGIRERDGITLTLRLMTNNSSTRTAVVMALEEDLEAVGFDITLEILPFNVMVDALLSQTYDMAMLGWTGLGTDPDDGTFWSTSADVPGSGFNAVSYSNSQLDELYVQGNSVPSCATAERAPFYKQIQQILHDDLPYVFLFGNMGAIAYTREFRGLQPGPWDFYEGVEGWSLR